MCSGDSTPSAYAPAPITKGQETSARFAKVPILVIGVGNVLLKDEGIGIHLVHELKKLPFDHEAFEFLDGGTLGLSLLEEIKGRHEVIVIDAMDMKVIPGKAVCLRYSELRGSDAHNRMSLHQTDFVTSIEIARFLEVDLPQIHIIGIQVKDISMGTGLSQDLQYCLQDTVALISRFLNSSLQA